MEIRTTQCSRFGHREFILRADEAAVPDRYLKDTARIVENMVESGEVFHPDETFQIGWMTTKVVEDGSTYLSLVEPDMMSLPVKWVPGITETLRTQMLQLFMLDSVVLRSEMKIPSIQQSLIACTRYTEPDFFMSRSNPSNESDSGWFIGCLDQSHDHNKPTNLSCVSLYEAGLRQRAIHGYVTFPVGSMIVCDQRNGLSLLRDGHELEIVAGSFLDESRKRRMA